MTICEIFDIEQIAPLHQLMFGKSFPYESYNKKVKEHHVYLYAYYEEESIIGYSIVIDQEDERNLYAWYGGLLPEYQGNGTTTKFFDIMVRRARDLNYGSITLASTNCRPHMLRLAIKYGFDIYDIKKRDYGEGNKIYFRFSVLPDTKLTIRLHDGENILRQVDVERILVSAYKNNCREITFEAVQDKNDEDIIRYAIKYCNSFIHKPILIVNTVSQDLQQEISKYNKK